MYNRLSHYPILFIFSIFPIWSHKVKKIINICYYLQHMPRFELNNDDFVSFTLPISIFWTIYFRNKCFFIFFKFTAINIGAAVILPFLHTQKQLIKCILSRFISSELCRYLQTSKILSKIEIINFLQVKQQKEMIC